MPDTKQKLLETVAYVQKLSPLRPKVAITLGSGLSGFGEIVKDAVRIPFAQIPHFIPPSVDGHGGQLIIGKVGALPVLILQGRIHYYEGHSMSDVVYPTRFLAMAGVSTLILTNAAGGMKKSMKPGSLMVISDQINLTGANPLIGPNLEFLGPRFSDMTDLYDPKLRKTLRLILKRLKLKFTEGVYCGVSGPCYETPAEIRFFQTIGCSAVGMSTVAEAIAARHAGLKLVGLSCITNLATGLSKEVLTHQEVKEVANRAEKNFVKAIAEFLKHVK